MENFVLEKMYVENVQDLRQTAIFSETAVVDSKSQCFIILSYCYGQSVTLNFPVFLIRICFHDLIVQIHL